MARGQAVIQAKQARLPLLNMNHQGNGSRPTRFNHGMRKDDEPSAAVRLAGRTASVKTRLEFVRANFVTHPEQHILK